MLQLRLLSYQKQQEHWCSHCPLPFTARTTASSPAEVRPASSAQWSVLPMIASAPAHIFPGIALTLSAGQVLNSFASHVLEWSEDEGKREALVQLGRSALITWLLKRAQQKQGQSAGEQQEAEATLLNLLADRE